MLLKLHSENDSQPRFEYYPVNSSSLKSVTIKRTPFTIGRGEHTELQINSASVSREHARLERTASGGYRLSDLGSTNGTSVNGKPITEQLLQDGDTVRVADFDLTFNCKSLGALQRMATQPLAAKPGAGEAEEDADLFSAARRLGESLLSVATPLRYESIVDLRFGSTLATRAKVAEPQSQLLSAGDCRTSDSIVWRYQELAWRAAAEQGVPDECEGALLLSVEQRGLLSAQCVTAFLETRLCSPDSMPLGLNLAWEWVSDTPQSLQWCREIRELGGVLSLDNFSGGAPSLDELESCLPDYLVLATEVVSGVANNQRRWQRLEIVQAACVAAGVTLTLPSGLDKDDEQACQSLGIVTGIRGVLTPAPARAANPAAVC